MIAWKRTKNGETVACLPAIVTLRNAAYALLDDLVDRTHQ